MVSIDKCHLVSVTADCLHYLMSISDSSEARASGIVHYEASFIMRLEDLSNAKYHGEQGEPECCPTSLLTTQIAEKNGSSGSGLTVINSRNLNMIISYA